MIRITCDNCDKPLDVPDEFAGTKYPCPHCGDVNRVPIHPTEPLEPANTPNPAPEARIDKAAAAGYPPDHGPEVRVVKVRRGWARTRPASFTTAVVVLLLSITGLIWILGLGNSRWWLWLAIPGSVGSTAMLIWWWIDRYSAALVITTKRTTMHTGFFRRSTSEVVHDNIRNIQVDQTFWQRLWRVGKLGISSSGQDGVEIQVNHLPNPDKLSKIIDLYRPL